MGGGHHQQSNWHCLLGAGGGGSDVGVNVKRKDVALTDKGVVRCSEAVVRDSYGEGCGGGDSYGEGCGEGDSYGKGCGKGDSYGEGVVTASVVVSVVD